MTSGGCQTGAGSSDVSLPSDGTYTIGVTPGASTGSVSFSLTDKSDVVGSITVDGPAVTVATTFAGQDASLNFDNFTPNRRVVLYVSNVSNPDAAVSIVKPGGGLLASIDHVNNSPAGQVFFLDAQTLEAVGA